MSRQNAKETGKFRYMANVYGMNMEYAGEGNEANTYFA